MGVAGSWQLNGMLQAMLHAANAGVSDSRVVSGGPVFEYTAASAASLESQ
jgi:hypothetical protein